MRPGEVPGLVPPAAVAGTRARAVAALERSRSAVLAGAARVFAERGLRRSTMQDVAAAAGLAKGTLYNHVRSKDQLARLLLCSELDRLSDDVAGRPLEQALALLADEVAGHAVLRRLLTDEPEQAARVLAVPPVQWARLVHRLSQALGVDEPAAELASRWLLGLALQPGSSALRHRQAALLSALLAPRRPEG